MSLKDIREKFIQIIDEDNVLFDEPMSKHTTFKLGGKADLFVKPKTTEELKSIIEICKSDCVPYLVVGNGSNMLVSEKGIEGVVICTTELDELQVNGNTINVRCGCMLSRVANEATKHSLTGLEFGAGIPGTIGGAVYMNAGAYDGEMKNVVTSVLVFYKGKVVELSLKECQFGYRSSIFQSIDCVILKINLQLAVGDKEKIENRVFELNKKRHDKQPLEFPSAGSVFRRPDGYYAAALIDQAGLSGHQIGGAKVSDKHCGFIVNVGNATTNDVLDLIEYIKVKVKEKYNIELHEEIKCIGRN